MDLAEQIARTISPVVNPTVLRSQLHPFISGAEDNSFGKLLALHRVKHDFPPDFLPHFSLRHEYQAEPCLSQNVRCVDGTLSVSVHYIDTALGCVSALPVPGTLLITQIQGERVHSPELQNAFRWEAAALSYFKSWAQAASLPSVTVLSPEEARIAHPSMTESRANELYRRIPRLANYIPIDGAYKRHGITFTGAVQQ